MKINVDFAIKLIKYDVPGVTDWADSLGPSGVTALVLAGGGWESAKAVKG